jgi:hypothetical protein
MNKNTIDCKCENRRISLFFTRKDLHLVCSEKISYI